MKVYRTELHGHVVECREGDLGSEQVFVDGRCVSDKSTAGWLTFVGIPVSHAFELADESGKPRLVEARWEAAPRSLGLRYRVRVQVDGRDRVLLEPVKGGAKPRACANCGYTLEGLTVEGGEVRCPECGRHTSASLAGLT